MTEEKTAKEYPLISVIVPVYNAEKFLRATIKDIQDQTYPNLEILLVDDGSADGSCAVCEALEAEDVRIRAFHKKNGGASSARNLGLRNAAGELIGFVDADDHIEPDMYERLYTAYKAEVERGREKGSFLVQTGRREIDEDGNALPYVLKTPEKEVFEGSEEFIGSLLLYTGDASFCTKLVPAACFEEYEFPEGMMGEDFLLHIRMLPEISGVLRIPAEGYRVVHRRGSATRRADASSFSAAYVDIVRHADTVEQETCRRYPALKEAAGRFGLYERLDYMLHVPIETMNADNAFYMAVKRYLRKNFSAMLKNPYLTAKNKIYLILLTAAPKTVRKVHRALKGKTLQ